MLRKFGGIYMDMDIINIRSYKALMHHSYFSGEESTTGRAISNAVIGSTKEQQFVKIYLDSYKEFVPPSYENHAVLKPMELARNEKFRGFGQCILPPYAFVWPLQGPEHFELLHSTIAKYTRIGFPMNAQFTMHMYEGTHYSFYSSEGFIESIKLKISRFSGLLAALLNQND